MRDAKPNRSTARRIGLLLLGLLLVLGTVFGAGLWWLGTQGGLDFALRKTQSLVAESGGELRIEDARGGLYRGVEVKALELRSGRLRVQARDVVARWSLAHLLQRHIGIEQFGARSLHIGLPEGAKEPEPKPTPMPPSFALPLTLDLQRFAIDELRVTPAGAKEDFVLRTLRGALAYRDSRYTLSGLGVASQYGSIEAGHIVLGAEPPHAIDAALRLAGEIEARAYTLNAKAKGDLERLRTELSATVAGAAVDADAALAPLAVMPLASVRASWQRLDLRALVPALPTTRIAGKASLAPDSGAAAPPGAGDAVSAWRGEVSLDNAEPGAVDAQRLPVQRFSTRLRITDAADAARLRIGLEEMALALGEGAEVTGALEVMPGRTRPIAGVNVPQTVAALQFRRIDVARIAATLPRTALDGNLALTQEAFELNLAQDAKATRTLLPGALAAASGAATIRAKGTLDERTVHLEMARVQLGASRLQMAGSAGIVAPYRVDLQGSAANLQPRQWLARAANDPRLRDAKINGDWSLRGDVAPGERGGAARVNALARLSLDNSRLAGRPLEARIGTRLITGQGSARIEQTQADLRLGANRVKLDGALGRSSDRMRIDLDLEEPQAIEPRLRGSIDVAGTLSGAFDALRTDLELRAQRLAFKQPDGDLRVGSIKLTARAPAAARITGDAPLDVDLALDDLQMAEKTLASLRLVTDGTVGAHRFRIAATREGQSLQLAGRGSASLVNEPSWRATLDKAAVDGKVPVTLRAPATLAIGESAAQVRDLALAVADGNLSIKALDARWAGQRAFSSQGELRDLPVVRLMELSGTEASADALRGLRLDGDWSLAGSTADDLSGQVAIALREEAVRGTVPIGVGTGAAGGAARDGSKAVGNGMRVRLDRGRLDGRIDLKLPSLAFTHALTAPDLVLDGRVAIDGTIAGTTRDPRVDALLTGESLQLLRRSVGWRLTDGELKARLSGRALELQTLRMRSGEGSVTVSGKAALRSAEAGAAGAPGGAKNGSAAAGNVPFDGRFTMSADRFLVPIGPGQRVLVSGNSELTSNPRGLALAGKLAVNQGIIEVQGSSAPALPDDVVLEGARDDAARSGAKKKKDKESAIRIATDLAVALGDKLRVTGRGVEAHLGGELHIGGTLPDNPQVSGPVKIVNGSYQAYGQNLRIERGDVRFNGPLDNPALDIVAKRPFLPVEVGLSISGTAKTPAIQLVSKPDMPQTDQLSWLVLGVSPDKSRSAAQSLALRQAGTRLLGGEDGPRKPSVAERLGLDVFNFGYGSDTKPAEGVTEAASPTKLPGASRSGSGSASDAPTDVVTIGKRFSDRLFISYEQGLRGVSNLLSAQYLLTERLSLRAQSGTASALDLLYAFAFD